MPSNCAPAFTAALSSSSVWTSTSESNDRAVASLTQFLKQTRIEQGRDEQNRVGPIAPRFGQLIGVDDEVLTQQRYIDCAVNLLQI